MSDALSLIRPDLRSFRPYASARRTAPVGRIRLDANESPWAPPGGTGALNRYPEPQPAALRDRLAGLYGVDGARLLLTRGSDEAMDVLCRAFCRAGLDEILITPPTFGMYEVCARLQGAGVQYLMPAAPDRLRPDLSALPEACGDRVKLVFLCSPANPTGLALDPEAVLVLCRRLAGRALVVLDEAYTEFADVPSLAEQAGREPNLVVLRTLSKAWGLAGARIGVLAGAPELVAFLGGLLPPYPLPAPSVSAAVKALSPAGRRKTARRVARLRAERERLAASLTTLPVVERVYPSQANFLLVRLKDPAAAAAACARAGIVVRDVGAQPALSGCVRITVGRAAENTRLLDALGSA